MRAVIQRVASASVEADGAVTGAIGPGLLVFLGIGATDTPEDAEWLIQRLVKLRVFEDADGRMNRSLADVEGGILVISQFTLYGSLRKGNRPSFNRAALPDKAVPAYEQFVSGLSAAIGKPVATGCFGAHMLVHALNDGPVTLVVDSQDRDF